MTDQSVQRKGIYRGVLHGESLIAWAGLSAAAVVLLAVLGASAWTIYADRDVLQSSRRDQNLLTAQLLGRSAEIMLASGEVSQLRVILSSAAATNGLSQITVTLPDPQNTLVADSNTPTKYAPLPGAWLDLQESVKDVTVSELQAGGTEIRVPLNVPDKGPALLSVIDRSSVAIPIRWKNQVGIGLVGVLSLGGMLGWYHLLRRRLSALGAIHKALDAVARGERAASVLSLAPSLGPDAAAWNQLMSELEQHRDKIAQEKAGERLGARRGSDGEMIGVCDSLWQGLLVIDDKLTIKYLNGAAAVFLRGRRDELAGAPLGQHVDDQKVLAAVRQVASGASKSRVAVESTRTADPSSPQSASVLRYSVRPLRKGDSGSALIVIEDLTQQRVADESRNAFVASATHELRTPLTNMRLYVDSLIEGDDQDPAKRSQAINVLSQEVRRLERLVGDMLSVSEIEAGQFKFNRNDVRLEPIFTELRNDFEAQARQQQVALKFELPPKWPQLKGDRDKIMLALHNLIGNAIKYTPAGGEITVKVHADNTTFNVEVIDTGIGVSEQESELIFEKFYRAKDKRIANITGTGLGLSIAREVVRLHGGDINVRSQIDKGSTFTMTLPLAA